MSKNKNNKKLVILVVIALILCMIISLLFAINIVSKNDMNKISNSITNNLSEIINNLGSKYISESESAEKGFSKDIYLEFKYDLYENNKSNEKIYINLIQTVISNEKSNIRLIDKSKDIIIRITYNSEDNSYYYTINNEENYFEKQNSIKSLNVNTDISDTELRIDSEELKNIIDSNWDSSSVNIEGEMNKFKNYEDYFYNGIKIRNVMSKVFNMVFTENYEYDVINGIKVGTDLEEIKNILGAPTLQKDNIIGYKNEDLYVLFSENEISIYQNKLYETEEFSKILSQYLNSEINLKKFMNELTYLWNDYSEYIYSSNLIYITYPYQGVQIIMNNYNDSLGITVYQNCNLNSEIKDFIKDGKITGNLEENLFCKIEAERLKERNNLLYQAKMNTYIDNNPSAGLIDGILSNKYLYTYEYNLDNDVVSALFLSKDGSLPDLQIKENIYTIVWMSDDEVIYSIKNKGIYYYNLTNMYKQELVTGSDEFYIEAYDDGILKYDENILEINEE